MELMIALSNLDKQLKQQQNSNNLLNELIESIQNARIQFSQKQCNTQTFNTNSHPKPAYH
jgi:hypothetical protein